SLSVMRRSLSLSILLALAASLVASSPATARADQTDACIEASVRGQQLRDQGKLLAAREQLLACGVQSCPRLLQKECAQWLAEVEVRTPSIVIGAVDAEGRDTADVKVTLDGAPLLARLDGRAQPIDPGAHRLSFEHAGSATVEQQVILREGERRRVVTVRFPPLAPTAPRATPVAPAAPVAAVGPARSVAVVALGGLAVASGVTFAVLGLGARGDALHLRTTCAPACDPADVDAVRAKQIGANVAFGTAILAAGAAAVLVFTWPAPQASRPALAVRPIVGGAIGGIALPF
ncbi:MAG: hypothetical protein ABI134_13005, partial [Byssovorax sp.]